MSEPIKFKLYEIEKHPDYKLRFIGGNLPKPCFRICLIGPSGSGKSSIIKNFVFNNSFGYRKYFSEWYGFIGSLDDIEEMKALLGHYKMDNVSLNQKYDDALTLKLFEEIEKDNLRRKNPARVCFIFDDQVCNAITKTHKQTTIDNLATRGRHAMCSYMISSQKYKMLNQNVRCLNCTHLFVFAGTQTSDLESIAEEHNSKYNKEEIMTIFKKYLDKKYEYVMFDNYSHKVFDKNFNEIIKNENGEFVSQKN